MSSPPNILRIALTPGEPAGIGPDLCTLISGKDWPCELIAICDPDLLSRRAKQLGAKLRILEFNEHQAAKPHASGTLKIIPVSLANLEVPGLLDVNNAAYVLKTINLATKGCLAGRFDAMVTGPVHKGIINDAGIVFTGHTEYIASNTGGHPVMMLSTPGLRVALATTHLPLAKVSQAITRHLLCRVLTSLNHDLKRCFGIMSPKILVCGLNPHAGENGYLGREEIETIAPALRELREDGLQLIGPLPADTIFTPKYLNNADAVLAMFHDQGLPVLKYAGFGNAVNITLGLPIIRTSVDHGTAIDLAGSGQIDLGSLDYAIQSAMEMSQNYKDSTLPSQQRLAEC